MRLWVALAIAFLISPACACTSVDLDRFMAHSLELKKAAFLGISPSAGVSFERDQLEAHCSEKLSNSNTPRKLIESAFRVWVAPYEDENFQILRPRLSRGPYQGALRIEVGFQSINEGGEAMVKGWKAMMVLSDPQGDELLRYPVKGYRGSLSSVIDVYPHHAGFVYLTQINPADIQVRYEQVSITTARSSQGAIVWPYALGEAKPQLSRQARFGAVPGIDKSYQLRLSKHLQGFMAYVKKIAEDRKVEGQALVRYEIDRAGSLLQAEIVRSTGHAELDAAILKMLELASPMIPLPDEHPTGRQFFGQTISVWLKDGGK